jgi:hypothetical protein
MRCVRCGRVSWVDLQESWADELAVSQLMKLYQNAWTADPDNLELGVQVFQHAIRIHDWKTMQQVSRDFSLWASADGAADFYQAHQSQPRRTDGTVGCNVELP